MNRWFLYALKNLYCPTGYRSDCQQILSISFISKRFRFFHISHAQRHLICVIANARFWRPNKALLIEKNQRLFNRIENFVWWNTWYLFLDFFDECSSIVTRLKLGTSKTATFAFTF